MKLSLLFCSYILSFFYILFLIVLYFSKNRLDNTENKIYKKLLITNFFGIIIQLLCEIFSIIQVEYLTCFLTKMLLIYFIVWLVLFFLYVLEISNLSSLILKRVNEIIALISVALIFFLPYKIFVNLDEGIYYTFGYDTKYTYFISILYTIVISLITIIKHKTISTKKAIPIYLLIFSFVMSGLIQYFFPQITIIVQGETFICLIMYFTIENPDLAMIEQLNIARDQADRANQAKSEFLSSMSHEIRTPLNAIVGFSQALQEENLPEQAQEEVKDIVRASESLLELVNGILDISKIEANKIEIVDGEYNIYEVLNDLTALSKARMGDKKLEFKTYFDKSIPPILYGDSVRVKQIILNLLTNSIKYTKEGEVVFRVSSIQNDNVCRLIVSVEDTGIGIKKESIDKLFTKFQRLDLEKNKTIEGTGLGLAITKRLVDLMNGRIMVQSVYGKGSKFTVALDQKIVHKTVSEVEQAKVQETISEEADFTGKKVLIVDDNKLNLKVASRLIEKFNCEIVTLESGFDCIDRIKSNEHFDIILMDDMMPNMSGVETFHKLKEIENFNTPVIALTANAISGMKEKYLSEGFNDYLSKPIEKTELNKILNKYLKN